MKIKTFLLFSSLITALISCTKKSTVKNNILKSNSISIQFIEPFNFKNSDALIIDGIKFTHAYTIDSINNGNILPKEKIIYFKVEEKKASSKTNTIKIARIFANKIKATNNYKFLNSVDILTKGIVKFKRKDNKPITVISNKGYLADINSIDLPKK